LREKDLTQGKTQFSTLNRGELSVKIKQIYNL